jgi:hypothetical protein
METKKTSSEKMSDRFLPCVPAPFVPSLPGILFKLEFILKPVIPAKAGICTKFTPEV